MTRRRWFLPETPDVLGLLRRQAAITIEGLDAFESWAAGDAAAAEAVRDAEHRGDEAKRELLTMVRAAFVTPIEPEDAFALSRGIDRLLNYARDLINESEAMACPPDERIAAMGAQLGHALRHIDAAIAHLGSDADEATEAADAAIREERRSSTRTTRAWPACWTSGTATSGSRDASSTAAARAWARPSSTSPSASSTPS